MAHGLKEVRTSAARFAAVRQAQHPFHMSISVPRVVLRRVQVRGVSDFYDSRLARALWLLCPPSLLDR